MLAWLGLTVLTLANAEPETIVPFQSEWLIWTGQNIPPNWPEKPSVRSATALQYAPTRQGDHRIDLTCSPSLQPCDESRSVDVWQTGLKAPFMAVPEKSIDQLSTYRSQLLAQITKAKAHSRQPH